MNIQPDFKELLKLLKENNVHYMIVGGYAVAWYGHPRFTKDLDIFYKLEKENVTRLKQALIQFGIPPHDLPSSLFESGYIIKMGVEPVRVDLLNEIDGVTYEEAECGMVVGEYDDIQTHFIGKEQISVQPFAGPCGCGKANLKSLFSNQAQQGLLIQLGHQRLSVFP